MVNDKTAAGLKPSQVKLELTQEEEELELGGHEDALKQCLSQEEVWKDDSCLVKVWKDYLNLVMQSKECWILEGVLRELERL